MQFTGDMLREDEKPDLEPESRDVHVRAALRAPGLNWVPIPLVAFTTIKYPLPILTTSDIPFAAICCALV